MNNGTPMQRDPVVTIFERSVEGRRAAQLPEVDDGLLVAITERRSREHLDRLAEVLGAAVAAERSGAEVPA